MAPSLAWQLGHMKIGDRHNEAWWTGPAAVWEKTVMATGPGQVQQKVGHASRDPGNKEGEEEKEIKTT